jgi:glyoxylase I family protein
MISDIIKKHFFIDHLVLTVTDIKQTKAFYSTIFGEPIYQDDHSIMYFIGATKLFLVSTDKTIANDKFDPARVGLNHVAINIPSLEQLQEIGQYLTANSIQHSGIHIDNHSKKEKIWLNDPDGIRLEFFIRP